VWELQADRETFRLTDIPGGALSVAWSPDGTRLATGSADGVVRMWDACTRQVVFDLKGHTQPVWGIAISPDGRRLASAAGSSGWPVPAGGEARIWDLGTGRELLALQDHKHDVYGVAFSADGKRFASAGADGVVYVWDFSKEG
jgi:WD40 repeat protein